MLERSALGYHGDTKQPHESPSIPGSASSSPAPSSEELWPKSFERGIWLFGYDLGCFKTAAFFVVAKPTGKQDSYDGLHNISAHYYIHPIGVKVIEPYLGVMCIYVDKQ